MTQSPQSPCSPTVVYLSHGGGPLPLLGDEGHIEMVENLKTISNSVGKPSAIIVVSAHWEEQKPTIISGQNPPLLYDYYGFPEEAYSITYPAPGETRLAAEIAALLGRSGHPAVLDDQRGFDHGLFIPLKIMYPEATIPCVQVSLLKNLDPAEHIRIGEVLAGLTIPNVLIIGSGFSFHNMQAFFSPSTGESRRMNEAFDAWLVDTCSNTDIHESERRKRLESWHKAPNARYCHPREEHLLPLHVCYGVACRACSKVFGMEIMGKKASAFLWQIS